MSKSTSGNGLRRTESANADSLCRADNSFCVLTTSFRSKLSQINSGSSYRLHIHSLSSRVSHKSAKLLKSVGTNIMSVFVLRIHLEEILALLIPTFRAIGSSNLRPLSPLTKLCSFSDTFITFSTLRQCSVSESQMAIGITGNSDGEFQSTKINSSSALKNEAIELRLVVTLFCKL